MSRWRRGRSLLREGAAALLSVAGLGAAVPAFPGIFTAADLAAAADLRRRALGSGQAYALVTSLTTEVGPRAAGSAGDRAAVAWALRTFERLEFERIRTMETRVPHWVRGTASLEVLAPHAQPMPVVALGGSVGTPDGGLDAQVLAVRDIAGLQALPRTSVEGRIVYFSQRMQRSRDGSGYAAAVANRTRGPSVAGGLGAAGVLIRSLSTSSNRLAHTGATSYNISAPRIPALALSNPDADQLERLLAIGATRVRMTVTSRDLPQARSANVIAEIPGTDRADEIVMIGAHLDSWDLGTGAIDDGAGVAIAIAAAKLIAATEPRPRRTVRVVLFSNEEFNLAGAYTYAKEESDALARHAVVMEADMGAGPAWRLDSRVAPATLPAVDAIHRELASLGIERGGNTGSGGPDLGPLWRAGVPVLAPLLDMSDYFDVHHSANDTLDKIDPANLGHALAAFAVTAYLAAQADVVWERLAVTPAP